MNIEELKKMKEKAKLTNQEIADLSGIPVSTVNKIFSGVTQNPRYATLLAIEEVLSVKEKLPFTYDMVRQEPMMVRESSAPYQYRARQYEGRDIEQLSEGVYAELLNGKLYMQAAPNRLHQCLVTNLLYMIKSYIRENHGKCHVYPAPFAVRLFGDDSCIVQPDLSIICRKELLTEKGCSGAPDWVIEIASASNSGYDYITKMMMYQKAGVREYWIVDPGEEKITVLNFENPAKTGEYHFGDKVCSGILENLVIRVEDFMEDE